MNQPFLFLKDTNTDDQLVAGLRKGDHECFKVIFDQYSHSLLRFSFAYLKSREIAEDVVQEVFTRVWQKREDLKTNTSFKSYLFTIALNTIRNHFNKLEKVNELKHDILFSVSKRKDDFDDNQNYQQLLDKLEELIDNMPLPRREVFSMKKIEGKSIREISGELEISPKTVEYHVAEAMKFLKHEFAKLEADGLIFYHLFIQPEKEI